MATVEISRYLSDKNQSYLVRGLEAIDRALGVLTMSRRRVLTQATQLVLAHQSREMLALGLEIAMELHEQTSDPKYLERAFIFAEEGKMAVLRDAIRHVEMQDVAGLSETFLDREKKLRQKGYQLDTQAAHQAKNGDGIEPQTRLQLIQHNLEVEGLLAELKQAFPKYFQLKYQTESKDLAEFQRLLGDRNRALLAYHLHGQTLTIFVLKETEPLMAKQVPISGGELPSRFSHNLDWLTPGREFEGEVVLGQAITQLRLGIVYEKKQVFAVYSRRLYELLIGSVTEWIAGHELLIIPDGPLAYLPFEVLLTQDSDATDWGLPYFIRDHALTYSYAASLLKPVKHELPMKAFRGLAFAPGFMTRGNAGGAAVRERALSQPLPHSLLEVKHIQEIFRQHGGQLDIWTEDAADLETFKKVVGNGQFIHLATHARIDEAFPALSSLYFANSKDDHDGVLYLGDIFGLEMNAELVVLSACETGGGSLLRGEGVMGFVRGLYYAGARQVLVSQWQVADISTAQMMTAFYEAMFSGARMDHALRQVKLGQIQQGSSPYAWAGFVLHSRGQGIDLKAN